MSTGERPFIMRAPPDWMSLPRLVVPFAFFAVLPFLACLTEFRVSFSLSLQKLLALGADGKKRDKFGLAANSVTADAAPNLPNVDVIFNLAFMSYPTRTVREETVPRPAAPTPDSATQTYAGSPAGLAHTSASGHSPARPSNLRASFL